MDILNAPDVVTSNFSAGVNKMFLQTWAIEEGNKGKQLYLEIIPEIGSTKTFKCWVPFQRAFTTDTVKESSYFRAKLRQYLGILENYVGEEKAQEVWTETLVALFSTKLDGTDQDALSNAEAKFITMLFKHLGKYQEKELNVLLHYNDAGFLNIPNYWTNKYNIPVGLNPIVADDLNMVKPTRDFVPVEEEKLSNMAENTDETPAKDDADLPF